MNISKLKEISEQVDYLISHSNDLDNDQYNQLKIFFMEVMDSLGYDESMSVSPGCVYATETLFDICFKTDIYNDSSDLVYLKYVDYQDDVSSSIDKVETAILYNTNPDDKKIRYYLISNGIAIKVYSNRPIGSKVKNIEDLGIIDMQKLEQSLNLIKLFEINKIEDEDNFEYKEEDNEEKKSKNTSKSLDIEDLKSKIKNNLTKILLLLGAIIFLCIIFIFLFKDNSKKEIPIESNSIQNIENNNMTNNKDNTNTNVDLNSGKTETVNYLGITAILDLTVYENETMKIDLISNLPEDAIVKLGIFCGEEKEYLYLKTNNKGEGSTKFEIPSIWGEEKIVVGAYFKFNESGYNQPLAVTKKYGENGENIEWNSEYSKDMITFSETIHSNTLVKSLLKNKEESKKRELMNAIEKDFSSIDTRVDSFGNIKHVPKGYSFDETNVSEKVNIYPMIFYDKEKDTSYFYIIGGYVSTQFLRFEGISFSCDGYNWNYENSTNEKKNKIVGNKKAEWVYFNNIDTSALLGDMKVLSNSNESKMILTGSINKTFNITTEEKNIIKQFLYIYSTYYGNGTTIPDTSWFSISGSKISLKHIVKPQKVYERGYQEINSLNEYSNNLATKEISGETISQEERNLLNKMNITYRVSSEMIRDKIFYLIINADATSEYYDDYETNKKYMKIYFDYGNLKQNIEGGYIPYINIYDDFTVLVPIKTMDMSTTKYDKTFAKFKISNTVYEELKAYFDSKQYEQINN